MTLCCSHKKLSLNIACFETPSQALLKHHMLQHLILRTTLQQQTNISILKHTMDLFNMCNLWRSPLCGLLSLSVKELTTHTIQLSHSIFYTTKQKNNAPRN